MNHIVLPALFLLVAQGLFSCSTATKGGESLLQEEFQWEYAAPESQGFSPAKLNAFINQLAEKKTHKLLIIRNDKIVVEWFAKGHEDSVSSHGTASMAKALVGGLSLLAAMNDGFIKPDDPASKYIPEWDSDPVKSLITIRHLATHTSGMEDAEVSDIEQRKMTANGLHTHMDLPGWKGNFWRQDVDPFLMARDSALIVSGPGTKYAYSNPGIGMLTYAVTSSLKGSQYSDVRTYLWEKIFKPIGIREKDYRIGYGKTFEETGLKLVPSWGGANFTARDVARIGRLMLKEGNWQGKQLIDASLVKEVVRYAGTALPPSISAPATEIEELSRNYEGAWKDNRTELNPRPATTLGWYSNFDGIWKYLPTDAFAASGAGNQTLLVVPSLELIVVRFGENLYNPSKGEGSWYGAEKYLFNPIIEAIDGEPYHRGK